MTVASNPDRSFWGFLLDQKLAWGPRVWAPNFWMHSAPLAAWLNQSNVLSPGLATIVVSPSRGGMVRRSRQSVIAPTGCGMTLIAFARTNTVSFP